LEKSRAGQRIMETYKDLKKVVCFFKKKIVKLTEEKQEHEASVTLLS